MPVVNDVALLRRRQQLLADLRTTTAGQLARRWDAMPGYAEDLQGRWIDLAGPVVAAAQDQAVSVQVAFLQRLLNTELGYDRAAILERAAIDIRQPFIALATALKAGDDYSAAVEAGRARAEGVGESAVQWASRAANDAASDDRRIVGWMRTVDANSCEWCQVVATQMYHSAESASFGHIRCGCGVDPVIGDRNPAQVLNHERLAELQQSGAVQRASESRQRGREQARDSNE